MSGVQGAKDTLQKALKENPRHQVGKYDGEHQDMWRVGKHYITRVTHVVGDMKSPQVGISYSRPNGDVGHIWIPISRRQAQLPPEQFLREIGPLLQGAQADLVNAQKAAQADLNRIQRKIGSQAVASP